MHASQSSIFIRLWGLICNISGVPNGKGSLALELLGVKALNYQMIKMKAFHYVIFLCVCVLVSSHCAASIHARPLSTYSHYFSTITSQSCLSHFSRSCPLSESARNEEEADVVFASAFQP